MLRRVFGEEPIALRIGEGPGAIQNALPQILAAIGVQRPTGDGRQTNAHPAPVSDLVLELSDPAVADLDGARRATASARLTYIPADGGPRVKSPRYSFTAPIGPIEAEELAWYLERYINWPTGYFEERAQRVVEALPKWGRLLYDSVDVDSSRKALDAWKKSTGDRRFTIEVDKQSISSDKQNDANEAATLLLGLPWELIHDDQSYLFQGARPVRVRRSLPNRGQQPALATKPPIRVLMVSPRPEDENAAYIDHRVSARPLVDALSQLGDLARFKLLDPPTFPALEAELLRAAHEGEPYHVVHFDGHGVYDRKHGLGTLCFEDPADVSKFEGRRSKLIDADEIARIVRDHRIPLFFLEACQTAKALTDPGASVAGRLLESGVVSVAAMSHSVLVETARLFIAAFYQELLMGKRVGQAMLAGQRVLKAHTFRGKSFTGEVHLHDWFVPVLFQEEQDPQLIREVPAGQVAAVIATQRKMSLGEVPEEPAHQFLGRSRDLLKAERMLARERYLVVQGSGGEGKTTFAAELARWLVATRRFARAAFTSVEQITEARQVLFSIGDQLVPNFASRVGTDDALGLQLLERALAEHGSVVVIDNVESILSDPSGVFDLCAALGKAGQTRLIFTSREALPDPFDGNVLRIGRLDPDTAIRLLGNLLPNMPESDESEQDLQNLVDAVGGHARSLVLIAREVGAAGVRHATENLLPVLQAIEAKHPGDRENSLLASAELSLRRLPAEIRQLIRPLSVFQGGGGFSAIGVALQLDQEQVVAVARAFISVGLADYVEPGYLRFDPALRGVDLGADERETAIGAWANAMAEEAQFLYQQQLESANLANNLTLLELPNLLAALAHLARTESPERVVDLATVLERPVSNLNRPKALARIIEIRRAAGQRLPEWSHARFESEEASVERLIDQGRFSDAVLAAKSLHLKAEAFGDAAHEGAAFDSAAAQLTFGRVLGLGGDAEAALPHLERSRERFERLNEPRMVDMALTDKANCLSTIGRYDEAVEVYQQTIGLAEQRSDLRSVALNKNQLATVRLLQKKYSEALRLFGEARELFEFLGEPASVALAWHRIGIVHQEAGGHEAADQAYQKSLNIKVQIGDQSGQAATLGQLGNLYSSMGRHEEGVRLYRQTVDIAVQLGHLQLEGLTHNNIADKLVKLGRFDEARREIERAIECKKSFGHAATPWTSFAILSELERAVGNRPATLKARSQAIAAYLAYRRAGGAPEFNTTQLVALVNQDPTAARAARDDADIQYRVAAEITLLLERPNP